MQKNFEIFWKKSHPKTFLIANLNFFAIINEILCRNEILLFKELVLSIFHDPNNFRLLFRTILINGPIFSEKSQNSNDFLN